MHEATGRAVVASFAPDPKNGRPPERERSWCLTAQFGYGGYHWKSSGTDSFVRRARSEDSMHTASRLTSLACVAALTIGACGSSYTGLSKAEFVKQALAICAMSAAKTNQIGKAVGNTATLKQVKDTFALQLVPAFNDEVAQLRALKPPKADRKTISKMLDDLSTGIDQAATAIKSLKSTKDFGSLTEPAGLKMATTEANAYGFGKCTKI